MHPHSQHDLVSDITAYFAVMHDMNGVRKLKEIKQVRDQPLLLYRSLI